MRNLREFHLIHRLGGVRRRRRFSSFRRFRSSFLLCELLGRRGSNNRRRLRRCLHCHVSHPSLVGTPPFIALRHVGRRNAARSDYNDVCMLGGGMPMDFFPCYFAEHKYCSELLSGEFSGKIHPLRAASSLSREECESLNQSIKEVIRYAVQVDADCSSFPIEWLFHYRWGKKSGKVNGKQIEFITAGGRTSAFVPELQKLSGVELAKVKSSQSRKTKAAAAADKVEDEGDGVEKVEEIKRPQPKRGKKSKGGNMKQQKKIEDNIEGAGEEEKPKKKIKKMPLIGDDTIPKEAAKENKAKSKSVEGKTKTHENISKVKKRSKSNEATTHQKKKVRK